MDKIYVFTLKVWHQRKALKKMKELLLETYQMKERYRAILHSSDAGYSERTDHQ